MLIKKHLKLILTIVLTIVIYIWIDNIYNNFPIINSKELLKSDNLSKISISQFEFYVNLFKLLFITEFIKPILVYIAGLIIIKEIK